MKSSLAIATIAIICATGHPLATSLNVPLPRRAPSFALAPVAGQNTESVWNGRWQGTTASGHQLVLQLQLQGERIVGRLIVGKQSAKIVYGKVVKDSFALTTDPIDGHSVDATGHRVDDVIELTIEGVNEPLTLTRVK
jgi:hypothetical protein